MAPYLALIQADAPLRQLQERELTEHELLPAAATLNVGSLPGSP